MCRSILIIEDEPDARESLRELLEIEGYPACAAANGLEALACLNQMKPPCMILLDLMMPVMNGWEFLEQIRVQHENLSTPIVVLSAAADVAELQHQRVRRVIKKPIEIDELLELAREHCAAQ